WRYSFAIGTPAYGINLLIRRAVYKCENALFVCTSIICTDFDSLVNQLGGKYSESLKPPLPQYVLRILIQIKTKREVIFHVQLRQIIQISKLNLLLASLTLIDTNFNFLPGKRKDILLLAIQGRYAFIL